MKALLAGFVTCFILFAGQAQADSNLSVFMGLKKLPSSFKDDGVQKQSSVGIALEIPGERFSFVASFFHSNTTHKVIRRPYVHKAIANSQELSFGLRKYYGSFYAEAGPVVIYSSKDAKVTYDGINYAKDQDYEFATGYQVTLGAVHRFTDSISLVGQVRFSDTFTDERAATGHTFSLGTTYHF